jgi:hypothetical protein
MDTETRAKLKAILLRSKLGQFVNEDENAFARTCWRQWPKEYSLLQTEEVIPEAEKLIPRLRTNTHSKNQSNNQSNATQPRHNSTQPRKTRPAQKRRPGPQRGRRS